MTYHITNAVTKQREPVIHHPHYRHPQWVLDQLWVDDEDGLRDMLDQFDYREHPLYDKDGHQTGALWCGIEATFDTIQDAIRHGTGDRLNK